jgi:putative transposase
MSRRLRVEFSGACYHVTNRGNYRRDLFEARGAAESFYRCLDQACTRYGWVVHAFVIMRNHFHLALETPEPNLSEGMKWLQGTWAQRFNRFRTETGRLFQGRYRAGHIEPGHVLAQAAHYIHLNPVRSKIMPPERMAEYRWSSLAVFSQRNRPHWLVSSTLLHESGGLADTPAGWRAYRMYLAAIQAEEPKLRQKRFAQLTHEWAIGSAPFRAELREKLRAADAQNARFELLGADRSSIRHARVEVWEDKLRALAASFTIDLYALPRKRSAPEKLTLAAAMKDTTSVSLSWLAQRLQMGATASVASLLSRFRKRNSGFRT